MFYDITRYVFMYFYKYVKKAYWHNNVNLKRTNKGPIFSLTNSYFKDLNVKH